MENGLRNAASQPINERETLNGSRGSCLPMAESRGLFTCGGKWESCGVGLARASRASSSSLVRFQSVARGFQASEREALPGSRLSMPNNGIHSLLSTVPLTSCIRTPALAGNRSQGTSTPRCLRASRVRIHRLHDRVERTSWGYHTLFHEDYGQYVLRLVCSALRSATRLGFLLIFCSQAVNGEVVCRYCIATLKISIK